MSDKKLTDVTDNNVGKMTDNKIIKALECCKNDGIICYECPYKKTNGCMEKLSADALDLINRLQAENEKLKKAYQRCAWERDMLMEQNAYNCKLAKAEAYKEFADLSIKRICEQVSAPTPSESYIVERCNQVIDNFLKELVGEDK